MEHAPETHTDPESELPSPAALRGELPASAAALEFVARTRREIEAVLDGRDRRLLCIVGPCSINDPRAALEYAERLAPLRARLESELIVCMRVFLEKPRTSLGWKGFLNDPALDGSCDLARGLREGRALLCELAARGMPAATETLDPSVPAYLGELVAWTAIGARTTESQTHRELASGLAMPVGFKNGTDGGLEVAICALEAARAPHSFIGIDARGRACVRRTRGQRHGHVVLRGGRGRPNYHEPDIERACSELARHGLDPRVLVDCSHGNSGKNPENQAAVVAELARSLANGSERLLGVMLESHLVAGSQPLVPGRPLVYGQSVTDACLNFERSETLLVQLAAARRRAASLALEQELGAQREVAEHAFAGCGRVQ